MMLWKGVMADSMPEHHVVATTTGNATLMTDESATAIPSRLGSANLHARQAFQHGDRQVCQVGLDLSRA